MGPPLALVVLTPRPEGLERWLGDATRARVAVLSGEAVSSAGWSVLTVPMDGPAAALPYAADGLVAQLGPAAPSTAVVLQGAPNGGPADPVHLLELARHGLVPGVDLAATRFAVDHGALLAGPRRVTQVEVVWTDRASRARLAALATSVATALPPRLERWLDDAEHDAVDEHEWPAALAALYVEAAVTALVA